MTDKQYEKLCSKFKHILCVFDNDLPGIQGLNKIHKAHPELKVAFIPQRYNAKDISDFYKMYGKDKTLELINEAKEFYFGKEKDGSIL
jgi:DNA primase